MFAERCALEMLVNSTFTTSACFKANIITTIVALVEALVVMLVPASVKKRYLENMNAESFSESPRLHFAKVAFLTCLADNLHRFYVVLRRAIVAIEAGSAVDVAAYYRRYCGEASH